MAPTNSCQEIHHTTLGDSPFAHPIPSPPFRTTRPLHRYSFRRVSFAHQRRFRSRQYPGGPVVVTSASAVNGPPPPYTPTIDLHPSIIPPTGIPATGATAADLHLPAPSQTRHRMSATAIALIVVCILVGLALCAVIGRFAYRKRRPLLRWPWQRTRREEESLGFVFVEYDDSTWGTPAKGAWREIPTFEAGSREREGREAHAPALLVPQVEEVHVVLSIPQPDFETPPGNNCRGLPPTLLNPIVETSEWDLDDTGSTKIGAPVIDNTLGLALGDNLELNTLTSSELAAALALSGVGILDVLARPDDANEVEETDSSMTDSLSSGLVACISSSTEESSGSEDDYELHRVETRSMDFKRGIIVSLGATTDTDGEGEVDEKPLPRVVISGSLSEEVFSSQHSTRVSGISEGTIDLGDFPRPPAIRL